MVGLGTRCLGRRCWWLGWPVVAALGIVWRLGGSLAVLVVLVSAFVAPTTDVVRDAAAIGADGSEAIAAARRVARASYDDAQGRNDGDAGGVGRTSTRL